MSTAQAPASRLRRLAFWSALAAVLTLTVALAIWWGADRVAREPLDPRGPNPAGARALAHVLEENGTEVEVVDSLAALEALNEDRSSTYVVTSTQNLGSRSLERLSALSQRHRVVVVSPSPSVIEAWDVPEDSIAVPHGPLRASCSPETMQALPDLRGLMMEPGYARPFSLPGCFPSEDGTLLSVLERSEGSVTLLASGEVLANESITSSDNAAIALRLLSQDDRLVWYVPSAEDLLAEDSPAGVEVPGWLLPGLWILLLSTVALALWQGRRLGPLSIEPLPVTVRAIESTLGRGRLLHRSRDRAHAAQALRRATARRLLRPGGTGPEPDTTALRGLIHTLAQRTGRPESELATLLGPEAPAPTDDNALVRLAQALNELEEEVRRS